MRPNFCFNTLIRTEKLRLGSRLQVQTYTENSAQQLRGVRFEVPDNSQTSKQMIEFPQTPGICFGHQESVDQNCRRLLRGRRTQNLKVKGASLQSPPLQPLLDHELQGRGETVLARRVGENLDIDELNKGLVSEVRYRLGELAEKVDQRRRQAHRAEDLRAKAHSFSNCLEQLKDFSQKTGQALDFTEAELKSQQEVLSDLPRLQRESPRPGEGTQQ